MQTERIEGVEQDARSGSLVRRPTRDNKIPIVVRDFLTG